jgi:serine/threonine-protein kinase
MSTFTTAVVACAVSALTFVAMQLWIAPRLPVVSVEAPALGGMTAAQARTVAEDRGLRLILDEEKPFEGATPGTICEQHPLPSSMLRRGDELHATIARQSDNLKVPRTAGMTPDAAREVLTGAHLKIGEPTQVADAQTPAGLVVGTTPGADTDVARGTVVALRVSTGAVMGTVPQLYGKRLSTAKQAIEQAGFALGQVKKGSDDDRDSGDVIGQTPKANEKAAAGSKIDVVVNE